MPPIHTNNISPVKPDQLLCPINASQHSHCDVGFPSVCGEYVLLPLVNKEVALAYGRTEYFKTSNSSRDRGGKKVE